MRTVQLGSSDLRVGEIGLGAMSLGPDPQRAREIVARAVDLGVTLIDTADLYDRGLNEELVGRALRGVRERVVIATKVGNRWRPDGSGWDWDPSGAHLRTAVHASLRRLGVDAIDLYQLHGGTIDDPIDEAIDAFETLKREGWIRHYGISSIRPNVIRRWLERSKIVSVMMQFSLLDRRPEELFPEIAGAGVSVIARGPVAKGLLATKAPSDYLEHDAAGVAAAQAALDRLAGPGSRAQRALRFALAPEVVACAVPGARTLEQLEENVAAVGVPPLTEAALERLRTEVPVHRYRKHR
jgi:aryl-alcohol dehydrogenase-like predicted oxidoreductase